MTTLTLVSDKCEKCGKEIKTTQFEIFGVVKTFKIMCTCVKEELRKKDIKEKEREKREKLSRLFRQSRLGERFKNANFNNIVINSNNNHIVNSLKDFAENFNSNRQKSFLLYSHPGTGKTLFASAVVNNLVKKYVSAIFITVPDLLTQIKECFNRNSDNTETNILKGLAECDLLVLDDIGAERHKEGDWASEKLYQIISARYNDLKATIFTTNCNSKQLQEKLGQRTFSRIIEMVGENKFNLDKEKDWRM